MKKSIVIGITIIASLSLVSCFNNNKPNYQFMPNMYEPIGYETYGDYEIFPGGLEAMLPVEGSIPRGWQPYDYPNTTEGLNLSKEALKNPLAVTEKNLRAGEKLYAVYCAVCHGDKGDGQGILVQREKFLGIPSYADAGRNITEGGVYHVQMFGLNSMGSYASQTNELERWQITHHVMNLKAALKGEPLMTPIAVIATDMENIVSEEVKVSEEH
jgi:mono/diheme cytochrome c family protein